MVQEQQLLAATVGGVEMLERKSFALEEREHIEDRIQQFIYYAEQGAFQPQLLEGIDPGLIEEALAYVLRTELIELSGLRQLFSQFTNNKEEYTERPEAAASIAAVKMLDANRTIPHVLHTIGIPDQSVQWKTVYMPVLGSVERSPEALTLLGGYDLLEQIRAKAFPPRYGSRLTAIAKLLETTAGQPELFAQASMHQALKKNAITGSAQIDGTLYSALYYQTTFEDPSDRELMAYLWLINKLPNQQAVTRIRFLRDDGMDTEDITEAVETGIYVQSDAVQKNSPIHQGQRNIPRESIAIQVNGNMLQISLKGKQRFGSFEERQAYFNRLNNPSIRATVNGVERDYTATDFLRESQEKLAELISNPLINMNKHSITRLREQLITMILHDAKYVMSGMMEQNEQVYSPEIFEGFKRVILEAIQSITNVIDQEIEAMISSIDENLEEVKGMVQETVKPALIIGKLQMIQNSLNRWNSMRTAIMRNINDIQQTVLSQEQVSDGTMNQQSQAMASFLQLPLLDLMGETSRFTGILSGYSIGDVIGSEAEAWQRAINRKAKKIADIGSVSFDVQLPPDLPDVIGNEVFMAGALKNIIQNAVKRNVGAARIDFTIRVEEATDISYEIPNVQLAARLQSIPLRWYRMSISNTGEQVEAAKALAFNAGQQDYSQRSDGTNSEGLALVREVVSHMNRADVIRTVEPLIVMKPFEDPDTQTQGTTIEVLLLVAPPSLSLPQLV